MKETRILTMIGGVPFAALTFDADQTLWDFQGVYHLALDATVHAILERGYASQEQVSSELLRTIRDRVVLEYRGQPHSLETVRNRSFQSFLEGVGHPEPQKEADSLTRLYMQVRFDSITLFPDVVEVLGRLGKRFPLGLLSNGNTHPERCGLPTTFSAIVMGPDHGFEKPDRRAFDEVARLLGVSTTEIVHVGDDWDDIEGANAVGATSVFLNRTGAEPAFAHDADHEVSDLYEFEDLLGRLSG